MYLIGKGYDLEEIKRLMQIDMCGEQTISQYNFVFENTSSAPSDNFELEVSIPDTLREEDLFEAVVRMKEIADREFIDKELNISVAIEEKIIMKMKKC